MCAYIRDISTHLYWVSVTERSCTDRCSMKKYEDVCMRHKVSHTW